MQLRQDRSVHVREILLVPSPDEGGGHQGDEILTMDRSHETKKKNANLREEKEKLAKKKGNQNNRKIKTEKKIKQKTENSKTTKKKKGKA